MEIVEIRNAIIKDVYLGKEGHGIMTFMIGLDYGGVSQTFGGYSLKGKSYGIIEKILDLVGVDNWDELVGKSIRVRSGVAQVHEIGNFLKDEWLNPKDYFKSIGL